MSKRDGRGTGSRQLVEEIGDRRRAATAIGRSAAGLLVDVDHPHRQVRLIGAGQQMR